MKKIDLKKVFPYFIAILVFLLITLAYFSPLLEGKKMFQSDIVNHQGVSKEIADFRAQTGQEPLWTNSMFGGMPAYQISVKYKTNLIGYLDNILTLGLPHPANLVFLYFLGFFILLLVMKADPWLSLVGAIAFAMSSYFFIILEAGHNSKAHAIGYMAPVIAGIILSFRGKYIWGGILTAIALSLEIKTNHPQITYYLGMMILILGFFKLLYAIREKQFMPFLKTAGVLLIALVFAVLTNLTSLWATYEYGKYTIRGKSELTTDQHNRTTGLDKTYVTQWSYGIGETMTLLIPDFYGGSSSAKFGKNSKVAQAMKANGLDEDSIRSFTSQSLPFLYWGDQPFTSGPVYVGALIFFLFILGLMVVKGPVKWWLLSATLLSILLSWGHNFMGLTELFLNYLPGYNKFRAVSMILVIAEFTMPLLGILALKVIVDGQSETKKLFKYLKISFGIVAGICLLFILLPGAFLDFSGAGDASFQKQYQFPDWLMQAIRDERLRLVKMDALRSLIFICLGAVLTWALIFRKIKKEYAWIVLIILILADMYMVNKRYVNNDSFTSKSRVVNPFEPSAADNQILEDKDPDFRVLNLTGDPMRDANTSYFHKSIGGYHGAKLRRYQELFDHHISRNNMAVLNMLNTRYIIIPDQNRNPVAQYNPQALGNAWFVNGYKLVDNADAELEALTGFKPDSLAIIDQQFAGLITGFQPNRDSLDFIKLDQYAPNALTYSYKSKHTSLAVFSEIYYPKGWNAYVDGQPTPHLRADYVLRAMILPAGEHNVVFKFEPRVYAVGETIALISSIVLILLVLILAFMDFRKARQKTT